MLNREKFYDLIRDSLFGGNISPSQFEGIDAILNEFENNHAALPLSALAYMFATVYHETDRTMQPIKEYRAAPGTALRKTQDRYWLTGFYGRGLVMLTWRDNYKNLSPVCGIDLVKNPDEVLKMEISVKILFYGMIHGVFTGDKLAKHFSKKQPEYSDFYQARRIINGTDRANLVATHAEKFFDALK